jgi:hypothetical protein
VFDCDPLSEGRYDPWKLGSPPAEEERELTREEILLDEADDRDSGRREP